MIGKSPAKRRIAFAWITALLILLSSTLLIGASDDSLSGKTAPKWTRSLPSASCPNASHSYCHRGSPVLADLTGDGKLEVVVATNRGHVLAYRHDGSLLWDRDVAGAFGMGKDRQRIASSPAVADIDADGLPEIVVGTGTVFTSICTQGGVITLEHNGSVKKGWPFLTVDDSVPPSGCRDSVFATPALGDLDKDGDLEIVFGAFDKRLYALNHNGKVLPGFPIASNLHARFGWANLSHKLADTMWSSPALGDIDGDGYLDIVTGTDEGNFDNSWLPVVGDWHCPYRKVFTQGYCGGSIYAVNRFGKLLPGFPRYELEIIQSTPAVFDADGDGHSEIFVGAGDFYHMFSPDKPQYGFYLFALNNDGRHLDGWKGGKRVGGVVTTSPALGDIDGDKSPEIVFAARDKKLYAFHINGKPVDGFPMVPRMHDGQILGGYRTALSPILADYTGDGTMEIFLRHAWEVVVVDGRGKQLTAQKRGDTRPAYVMDGPVWNSPAVGDLDGDGYLELVIQNSKLSVWRLPNASTLSDWPMFKQNAARTGALGPEVQFTPSKVQFVNQKGQQANYVQRITIDSRMGTFNWSLKTDNPDAIRIPENSGTVTDLKTIDVKIKAGNDLSVGVKEIGMIELTISQGGKVHTKADIPVRVTVVRNLNQVYLPLTR